MLRYSEHALHQIKGCPEKCPLVDGKPCDPDATYTKVPDHLRDRPEVKGHAHLCDPCLELVKAQHDREEANDRWGKQSEREMRKQLKVEARTKAREAEARLKDAYDAARTAHTSAETAGDDHEATLERLMAAEDEAHREVKLREQEMLAARQRLAQAKKRLTVAENQASRLPAPDAPADAQQKALADLRGALAAADVAWQATTPSARKKGISNSLHKRANKLLRQSS